MPPGSNRERNEIEYNSQEYRPNNSLFKGTLPQNFDPLLQPGPHELAKTILLVLYIRKLHMQGQDNDYEYAEPEGIFEVLSLTLKEQSG